MKKSDFDNFKFQLSLSIDLDVQMRRLQELIKLAYQLRNEKLLQSITSILGDTHIDIENVIERNLNTDEE